MSMNEELQSANEELETSKEELQSLNEELTTVNSQLQDKVEELNRSSNDLTNLMVCSDVATVFLDTQLRIKRFTPPVGNLLNLRSTDIDRPVSDLALKFVDSHFWDDCRAVLDKLIPVEREVWSDDSGMNRIWQSSTGDQQADAAATNPHSAVGIVESPTSCCYLRRILPYRTADNRIDGVVITFLDITERIKSEAQARRLAAVLRSTRDALTIHDFDGKILAWNRGAEQMYGYSEAEALQMNILETVPQVKRVEALAYVGAVTRNESIKDFETQRVTKEGRTLDIDLTVTAYRDEKGQAIGVATIERDITERKRLTTALRELTATLEQRVESQTREFKLLAEAVSHLGEGVMITGDFLDWPGPKIVFVNEAMCQITEYKAEELLGETPRILQGKDTSRESLNYIKQELTANRSCSVELVNYRKDGSTYDADLFITALSDQQGHRTNFISVHRDITERKKAEAVLRDREERMRAILNTATDAIVTIDQKGIITSVNPATSRMFQYSQDELVGNNVRMLMPPPYCNDHDTYIDRYLKTGEGRVIGIGREAVGRRKDGSTFPVDLSVSQVDHLGLFTGMIRDISLSKQLQRQVLEIATDEQRRIGQELHDVTGQELTGLSLFAGTLSDLLNSTPRRASDNEQSWVLSEPDLSRLRETAGKLTEGLVAANRHVQDLSHGIMPVQIEVEGLRSALEELAEATGSTQNMTCTFECSTLIDVADNTTATHLYRIAQEAVNNALKHSRADHIHIQLRQQHDELVLEVSDNGEGFDPASMNRTQKSGAPRGFGLEIMNYRAGMIGGTLRIVRQDTGGMLVQCVAPGNGRTA